MGRPNPERGEQLLTDIIEAVTVICPKDILDTPQENQ